MQLGGSASCNRVDPFDAIEWLRWMKSANLVPAAQTSEVIGSNIFDLTITISKLMASRVRFIGICSHKNFKVRDGRFSVS